MEIEKLLNDDSDVRAEVDSQGPWFDMVRDHIHSVKIVRSKIQMRSSKPLHQNQSIRHVRLK